MQFFRLCCCRAAKRIFSTNSLWTSYQLVLSGKPKTMPCWHLREFIISQDKSSQGSKQRYSFWNQDTYLRIFEATTDNGFEKDNGVTDFNNGDMAPSYGPVRTLWTNAYLKIAKCNNFFG